MYIFNFYNSGNTTKTSGKIGRIDTESIENKIGNLLDAANMICSDSHLYIIAWTKEKQLEHHSFIASKQHVQSKCFQVQYVNSTDNIYER